MSEKAVIEIGWIFLGSLFTAWIVGAIGNAFGISGTYWGWYWFSVSTAFLRELCK